MRWLKEFTDPGEMSMRAFSEAMTMSGSKVEGWETEGSEIENVVVGRVLSLERHPDSDHLWICQVDVGQGEPVQIVTGAQNLKAGDVVPAALHNSLLPGGKKIKKGKLRGVESNGMLCSLGELGLTAHDFPSAVEDGIFVLTEEDGCDLTLGQPIQKAIGLDDTVVEFEITPSGTAYYNGNGERVENLGVHEHWNNSQDKQYSRNLGASEGIELIYLGSDKWKQVF